MEVLRPSDDDAGALVEVADLVKHFGPFAAVSGISFDVARGEVLGFLGPNGAGKSTTMKMVTGFLEPTRGTARVCGADIRADRLAAQRKIGYLPEGAPAYGEMTVLEFLGFIAEIRRLSGAARRSAIDKAVAATELEGVAHQPIDTLSKGFRRRVGLAQSILHDPPVLIMDEPTDGLDPNQKHQVRKLIAEMAAEKAIVISTHILEEVDAICSRAIIIDRGKVVADGTPAALMQRSRYHNAVSLTLPAELAAPAEPKLAALPGVDGIELQPRGADATLTLFQSGTEGSTQLVDAVSRLARAENLSLRALYTEAGRLDEVFRRLTRSDGEAAE